MTRNPALPALVAAVVLALAAVLCSVVHVAAPDFLPYTVLALLGVSGGATIPGLNAPQPPAPAHPVAAPVAVPVAVAPAAIIPGPAV